MDAVEYLKIKQRMLKSNKEGSCNISCNICPFYMQESTTGIKCDSFEVIYPEKAVAIVKKWAAEHPVKTRQSEFLKMFPDTPKYNDFLDVCPMIIGGVCEVNTDCAVCKKEFWLAEVEDEQ